MASAFWTLEDGRVFAGRWSGKAYILNLIVVEMDHVDDAGERRNHLILHNFTRHA